MRKQLRQNRIMEQISKDGEASVEALCQQFGISEMTVRRDLTELAKAGKIRRTHGGAILEQSGVIEFAIQEKLSRMTQQKQAIARTAAELIQENTAISLDTGTTTLEVARTIAACPGLTVLTTSIAIASVLYTRDNINLVLLGGTVRRNSPDMMGPLTEDNLKRFRVHHAVVGADAVTSAGLFTTDVSISRIASAMLANAEKTILVVDSSKFAQTAFVRYGGLDEIDYLITDNGCTEETRKWLEESVADVRYV